MRFKHWLLTEDFKATDSDATGDALYPTNAGDYAVAADNPLEHWWLQKKWDQEKKQGRQFYNIDQDEFLNRGYTAIQSLTMPDKRWRHKPDRKADVKIVQVKDLQQIGVAKDSKSRNPVMPQAAMLQWILPLDDIFKDKSSGKWPEMASNKRWRK